MILRRIVENVRTRDWCTVIIEFLIAVVVIFVGLQVTEWNEQGQLREHELKYLMR